MMGYTKSVVNNWSKFGAEKSNQAIGSKISPFS